MCDDELEFFADLKPCGFKKPKPVKKRDRIADVREIARRLNKGTLKIEEIPVQYSCELHSG